MSSTSSAELTEEQKKFLASLEEEFKDRYTENDEEFKAVLNERLPLPPIVENWGDFRRRDDRYDNYRSRYNRYNRDHDHYDQDRDGSRSRDSRYNPHYRDDGGSYSHSSRQEYRNYERSYHPQSENFPRN